MNPYKMGAMRDRTYRQRGQSFTELAIFMPILILLLAGMVEVVFLFNDYLQMLDAARNGSREASDSDPFPAEVGSFGVTTAPSGAYDAIKDCGSTQNFFRNTACNTNAGLGPLILQTYSASTPLHPDASAVTRNCSVAGYNAVFRDDIVVTVFAIAKAGATGSQTLEIRRYDDNTVDGGVGELVPDGGDGQTVADGGDFNQSGWSLMEDQYSTGGMCSTVLISDINNRLADTDVPLVPNTAFVMVEVFITHEQIFNVPGFGDLIPNPIPVHSYAIFPLVSAEPTPTP